MTLMTGSLFPAPAPRALYVGKFTSIAVTAFDWLHRRLELARSRAELLDMDDRMLSDIGVDRASAKAEGHRGFFG